MAPFVQGLLALGQRLLGSFGSRAATSASGAAIPAVAGSGLGGFISRLFGFGASAARAVAPVAGGVVLGNLLSSGGSGGGALDLDGDLGGGNGKNSVVTLVVTVDNETGEPVRVKKLRGSPYLMRRDFQTARRVQKLITKGYGKLPRRTVAKSDIATLKDDLVAGALKKARAC